MKIDDKEFMKMVADGGAEAPKTKPQKRNLPKPKSKPKELEKLKTDFKEIFMQRVELTDRQPIYIDCETYEQLRLIVNSIGGKKASMSGYAERIIQVHFEQYKDEIIRLYNENLKQPFQ